MMNMDIHDTRLSIAVEYPDNGLSTTLRVEDTNGVTEMTLYMRDLDQWWALRTALPKSDDYRMATGVVSLRGDEADAYAREFYDSFLALKTSAA